MHTSTGGRVVGRGSGPSKGTEAEVYSRELVANICATYAVRGLFGIGIYSVVGRTAAQVSGEASVEREQKVAWKHRQLGRL